jgi:hypothetical protein
MYSIGGNPNPKSEILQNPKHFEANMTKVEYYTLDLMEGVIVKMQVH